MGTRPRTAPARKFARQIFWAAILTGCLGHVIVMADEPALTAERLFDPLHVIDVQIELPAADWESLCGQTRTLAESLGKTPPKRVFTYFRANVTIDGVRIEDVGVRKRGFLGSLDATRPSLKVKFAEYKDQSPVAGLDRLTLHNNKQDRSLASQFLSYKTFNESGTLASRCNHAKVTVNGESLGIYSHIESIKPPFLKRQFGDAAGHLYEGTVADFFVDTIQKFETKTKQTELGYLTELATVLAEDELELAELERILDIDAFVKFWAAESLIGFWDGYTNNQNNYYVYRNPSNSKLYFVPWGIDSAFTWTSPLPPFTIKTKSVHSNSVLANRLYRDPRIQEKYHATMRELLAEHWDESELLAELDRVEQLLKDDVHESQADFPKALNKVRSFVKTRRKALQKEIDNWPIELAAGPRRPGYFGQIGKATATFSTKWSDKSPKAPFTTGTVDIDFVIDGQPVTFRQIGVSAEPSRWPAALGGDASKPPTIVFKGKRESDGKRLTLAVGLPVEDFHPTQGEPAVVQGLYIEGVFWFLNPSAMKWVSGWARFDEAGMTPGAVVRGKVDLKVMQMKGGERID